MMMMMMMMMMMIMMMMIMRMMMRWVMIFCTTIWARLEGTYDKQKNANRGFIVATPHLDDSIGGHVQLLDAAQTRVPADDAADRSQALGLPHHAWQATEVR